MIRCVVLLAVLGWSLAEGRNVTKCELRVQVRNIISNLIWSTSLNGPRLDQFVSLMVGKIVCHADTVSHLNTSVTSVDGPNQNCTLFGLFQLSSCRFCDDGTTPTVNICGMPCSNLVDEDISDDVGCLLNISAGPDRIEMRLLQRLMEITSTIRKEACEHVHPGDYFADCH